MKPTNAAKGPSGGRRDAGADARAVHTSCALTLCPLGSLVFALDTASVDAITDLSEQRADSETPRLDLARFIGAGEVSALARRRLLGVRAGERPLELVVGSEVLVRELPLSPRPFPPFLAGLAERACCRAFVPWQQGYAFVLDLAALRAHHLEGAP